MTADLFTRSDAVLSPCGRYRYRLTRTWDDGRPAAFVMLNPSTADADRDDPTVRRCVAFARAWGCAGLVVVNLFAFRATDPYAMREQGAAAVGPENDAHIRAAVIECSPVVCAWGAHGGFLLRDAAVRELIRRSGLPWGMCLGLTKGGHPRHPLYVPATTLPVPYHP
jgi:hypothetical protein